MAVILIKNGAQLFPECAEIAKENPMMKDALLAREDGRAMLSEESLERLRKTT